MTTPTTQAWASLISELNHFGTLEDGWDGHDIEAPGHSLVKNAISLAEMFRDWGAPPATRVSSRVSGMIHFEWLQIEANVVIALNKAGEAEVNSFTKQGWFTSEVYQWDTQSIRELAIQNNREGGPFLA